MNFKKVLVLSPHTDDGELGAGGTIARLVEAGAEVHYVAFAAPTVKHGKRTYDLKEECEQALKMLRSESNGVSLNVLKFERRRFHEKRQEICDWLHAFSQIHAFDLVLTPCTLDTHQDHQAVTNEAIRVFKQATIFGYIHRWNCITIKEDVIIPLAEHHLHSKLAAVSQYYSQYKLRRKYFNPDFHKSEAYVRGIMTTTGYAEAFELIRLYLPFEVAPPVG